MAFVFQYTTYNTKNNEKMFSNQPMVGNNTAKSLNNDFLGESKFEP